MYGLRLFINNQWVNCWGSGNCFALIKEVAWGLNTYIAVKGVVMTSGFGLSAPIRYRLVAFTGNAESYVEITEGMIVGLVLKTSYELPDETQRWVYEFEGTDYLWYGKNFSLKLNYPNPVSLSSCIGSVVNAMNNFIGIGLGYSPRAVESGLRIKGVVEITVGDLFDKIQRDLGLKYVVRVVNNQPILMAVKAVDVSSYLQDKARLVLEYTGGSNPDGLMEYRGERVGRRGHRVVVRSTTKIKQYPSTGLIQPHPANHQLCQNTILQQPCMVVDPFGVIFDSNFRISMFVEDPNSPDGYRFVRNLRMRGYIRNGQLVITDSTGDYVYDYDYADANLDRARVYVLPTLALNYFQIVCTAYKQVSFRPVNPYLTSILDGYGDMDSGVFVGRNHGDEVVLQRGQSSGDSYIDSLVHVYEEQAESEAYLLRGYVNVEWVNDGGGGTTITPGLYPGLLGYNPSTNVVYGTIKDISYRDGRLRIVFAPSTRRDLVDVVSELNKKLVNLKFEVEG